MAKQARATAETGRFDTLKGELEAAETAVKTKMKDFQDAEVALFTQQEAIKAAAKAN